MYLRVSLYLFLITSTSFLLYGFYPEVSSDNSDLLYKQIQSDLVENNRRISEKKDILPIQFYSYNLKNSDTIFIVASRFNITYETLATLNNIDNQLFFNSESSILIPNCQGIFLKEEEFEGSIKVNVRNNDLYFYPDMSFSGKERLEFLITPFKSPLKYMYVTSEFGNRENPFTTITEFHSGIDLKAVVGTDVYAPYKGTVNNIGYSDFYGNYLIINHNNGYSSHFYHLNSISVKVGDSIKQGESIAKTGNTGRSTGAHLHYEIHLNEEPINPRILLGDV